MRLMSDFREAMWGVVQSAISDLDFDFDGVRDEALRPPAGGDRRARLRGLLEDAGAAR